MNMPSIAPPAMQQKLMLCPSCQAHLIDADKCQQCGVDLHLPLTACAEAEHYFVRSVLLWQQGQPIRAMAAVDYAIRLHQLPLYQHWLGFMVSVRKRVS